MIKDIAQLIAFDQAGELSSLKPLTEQQVEKIAIQHPGISPQYLEFIRKIGVGATTREFYVYAPEPASSSENHPSYQLYQSLSYRTLTGRPEPKNPFPADAIAVADCGASWWYCLCPSLGPGVFCLDMGGPSFEPEYDDFFSFVAGAVVMGEAAEQ